MNHKKWCQCTWCEERRNHFRMTVAVTHAMRPRENHSLQLARQEESARWSREQLREVQRRLYTLENEVAAKNRKRK